MSWHLYAVHPCRGACTQSTVTKSYIGGCFQAKYTVSRSPPSKALSRSRRHIRLLPAGSAPQPQLGAAGKLPKIPGAVSLLGCLQRFVRPERLGAAEHWVCGGCARPQHAVKQMSVHRLPPVLCLHVKRFEHTVRPGLPLITNKASPWRTQMFVMGVWPSCEAVFCDRSVTGSPASIARAGAAWGSTGKAI